MNKIAIALIVGVLASVAQAADHTAATQNAVTPANTVAQDAKAPASANTTGQDSSSQSRY